MISPYALGRPDDALGMNMLLIRTAACMGGGSTGEEQEGDDVGGQRRVGDSQRRADGGYEVRQRDADAQRHQVPQPQDHPVALWPRDTVYAWALAA